MNGVDNDLSRKTTDELVNELKKMYEMDCKFRIFSYDYSISNWRTSTLRCEYNRKITERIIAELMRRPSELPDDNFLKLVLGK